jgi:hypothetical protein
VLDQSSIGLVISYKSSTFLICLGGLGGLSLLELLVEKDDNDEIEFIGDCGGVTSS